MVSQEKIDQAALEAAKCCFDVRLVERQMIIANAIRLVIMEERKGREEIQPCVD